MTYETKRTVSIAKVHPPIIGLENLLTYLPRKSCNPNTDPSILSLMNLEVCIKQKEMVEIVKRM